MPVLETGDADQLKAEFQLDPGELEEVRSKAFTLLDAHYLDACILLREASQSLHVDGAPRRAQAAAAFAWVVRQLRLREDVKEIAPPQFALHRGWGTALERAYVFIDLLRQMNFTACLIAVPGTDEQAGPQWWAVGVADGNDIVLFDPRLGLPIPGPGGSGIATLAQACSAPQVLQQLTVDKKTPYDITADSARKATIYLTCPLSGLAPRMSYLQEQVLSAPPSLRLRVDPRALASQPAFKDRNIGFLGTGADPNSPLRLLRSFLPRADGGADGSGRKISLDQSVIPWENLPQILQIQKLPGEPGNRLRNAFIQPFLSLLLKPNSPRDYLLRGRIEEATKQLVSVREQLKPRSDEARSEADLEQKVTEWAKEAIKVYASLSRIQTPPRCGWLTGASPSRWAARSLTFWPSANTRRQSVPRRSSIGAAPKRLPPR